MTFLELLYGAEVLSQSGNPSIGGLEYDSRRIKPGDAFVAMQGNRVMATNSLTRRSRQEQSRSLQTLRLKSPART